MKRLIACILVFGLVTTLRASSVDDLRAKLQKLPAHGHERAKATLTSELATQLYKQGQMEEAAATFETALQHNTTRAMRRHIYLYMGKSYESYGRLDKAVSAYEVAVSYDKKNWRRHRDLGLLYEQTQLYRKAIASYETALKRNSNEPSLFLALGRTWRKMGLYPEALEWLNKASDANFEPETVQTEFSLVYEGQGLFSEAAWACSKSLTDNSPLEAKARLLYLAILAGDNPLIKKGQTLLAKAPKETTGLYLDMLDMVRLPPAQIRAERATDPNLKTILRIVDHNDTTQ